MKTLLETAALILGLVNGLMLLWFYYRDRPKLTVTAHSPEYYQWYFSLPGGEFDGEPTRKYGFLAYLAVTNRGLRDVGLEYWHLILRLGNKQKAELQPISLPSEPMGELGQTESLKVFPVLGQGGFIFGPGDTLIKSGGSISGMAYYIFECFGDAIWDPMIKDGTIAGKLTIRSAFGRKATINIDFKDKPLEQVEKLVPGITKIDAPSAGEMVIQSSDESLAEPE